VGILPEARQRRVSTRQCGQAVVHGGRFCFLPVLLLPSLPHLIFNTIDSVKIVFYSVNLVLFMAIGRPPGAKNKTPAELLVEAELLKKKAETMLLEKKKEQLRADRQKAKNVK
jgi:hypothetical protein